MKKSISLVLLSLVFVGVLQAQQKKKQDRKAIKSMCGCFEVAFNFAETFEYSNDSTYTPSKIKHDNGLEWVQLVTDTDDKIMLQHLLIVGPSEQPYIVKHWRQDWEYQNTDLYEFDHDNKWKFVSLPKKEVEGQWSQKVFQVDDSPRYEGTATWVHVDGKSYWENTTDAPLPRREYTTRSDYNVTTRTNRQEIVANGWIHDQDNNKVIRENGKEDVLLAQEKGHNKYVKVADSKCKSAQEYWASHEAKWQIVRLKWDEIFARNKDLLLEEKVDNKVLFKYLFDDENYNTAEQINPVIESFVK
ncbi:DUF6607 family protein [Cellulophaga sp. HaHa_2_1]|uniref:DUF6607 family protein n=1 Tax=Cellulophaga sp. HaHa_2_1 TaxID=2749994 RepID=UPI001C4F1A70|nr:DUF6607 family protein [Cellulophaga sp. HaHa_2_1]QXP51449.1 hypothetical protein H0I24_15035 [Cellulophaga sp. HaHa_2_1]